MTDNNFYCKDDSIHPCISTINLCYSQTTCAHGDDRVIWDHNGNNSLVYGVCRDHYALTRTKTQAEYSISYIAIISLTARRRSHLDSQHTYLKHLREQSYQHRHLLIAPILLTILALPRLIISFLFFLIVWIHRVMLGYFSLDISCLSFHRKCTKTNFVILSNIIEKQFEYDYISFHEPVLFSVVKNYHEQNLLLIYY